MGREEKIRQIGQKLVSYAWIPAVWLLVFFAFRSLTVWEEMELPLFPSQPESMPPLAPTWIAESRKYEEATRTPGVTPTLPPSHKVVFSPGQKEYHFYAPPADPEPGADWYVFPTNRQALEHLRKTGAKVAAFCRFEGATPTPPPPGYPAEPHREGDVLLIPYVHRSPADVIHIVVRGDEGEGKFFLVNVLWVISPEVEKDGKMIGLSAYCDSISR